MENVITLLVKNINPYALPFVLLIIGCFYIYLLFRFKKDSVQMNKDKLETQSKESQELRDICKENSVELKHLKEELATKTEILDNLRSQVNELNVNLAIISERIVSLVEVIKELKS